MLDEVAAVSKTFVADKLTLPNPEMVPDAACVMLPLEVDRVMVLAESAPDTSMSSAAVIVN